MNPHTTVVPSLLTTIFQTLALDFHQTEADTRGVDDFQTIDASVDDDRDDYVRDPRREGSLEGVCNGVSRVTGYLAPDLALHSDFTYACSYLCLPMLDYAV
ncbi:hypothetical protein C8J55DRAFT_122722 [Lentinula edodes]|uniref:Uncharacterized protein n=1 Tax=Lentinula lateritia TaxID=40482 RepID=A0A9W9DLH6_9AGAR|nr:hypothetical protein C8J55DRAFT_122722 [Lentinula edodes]